MNIWWSCIRRHQHQADFSLSRFFQASKQLLSASILGLPPTAPRSGFTAVVTIPFAMLVGVARAIRNFLIDSTQIVVTLAVFLATLACRVLRVGRAFCWVLGPDDEVGVLPNVRSVLADDGEVLSVITTPRSTHSLSGTLVVDSGRFRSLRLLTFGPIALGVGLAHRSRFFLLGRGELLRNPRMQDRLMRWRSSGVAWMFLGSDIRSPTIFSNFMENSGHLSFTDFQHERSGIRIEETEHRVKCLADRAMQLSQLIVSPEREQSSYLDHSRSFVVSKLCMIAISDEMLNRAGEMGPAITWSDPIKVLHAPSNRSVKGTLIVREAVVELRRAGVPVSYQEITGSPNSAVLEALDQSDVLVNSLMQHTPGMLGLEGLALGKLVIMSADPELEPALPRWSADEDAWLRYRPGSLFSLLSEIARDPHSFDAVRREGYRYCKTHFALSERASELRTLISKNLVSHDPNRCEK